MAKKPRRNCISDEVATAYLETDGSVLHYPQRNQTILAFYSTSTDLIGAMARWMDNKEVHYEITATRKHMKNPRSQVHSNKDGYTIKATNIHEVAKLLTDIKPHFREQQRRETTIDILAKAAQTKPRSTIRSRSQPEAYQTWRIQKMHAQGFTNKEIYELLGRQQNTGTIHKAIAQPSLLNRTYKSNPPVTD